MQLVKLNAIKIKRGVLLVKKILLLVLICIFLISGCAINTDSNYDSQISELEERNRILEAELEEKNNYIKRIEEKEDLFTIFAYLSTDFVRGQTQGDAQKLREVVADNVSIVEDNNQIYGIFEDNGTEVEFMLYNGSGDAIYKDMIIQGSGHYEEREEYTIHIREFFELENGEPVIPPTFLNLHFKNFEGNWKITSFYFDV